ncbi:MAG: 3-phosphoshikimate 1-carboxyvinyltransferase [Bacteroidales bacterium]|nr:3-phosphoshikimate 1-carboxyvinyltransferase [Bacteroidales bacterium]MDD4216281.1 3-phosphoshikimate 1-carboxyvinyltransferase [Bacteroidales bacterium]MDY0141582.1 3-phosphoshikimate 1-carboxyvinyltransferase [Bacteroidales bacterium]
MITAPSSKSYEQRLLVAALLSRGECILKNSGNCDDIIAAREIVKKLGLEITETNNSLILKPAAVSDSNEINCGESAMNARLFAPVSCLFKNHFTLTGSGSLLSRPIATDFYIFKQMGCIIDDKKHLPINFENAQLKSGTYNIDGSKTSQLISGLMMALPVMSGNSELIVHNPVSLSYIYLTQQIMADTGVKSNIITDKSRNLIINIPGNQSYIAGTYIIDGDWSGAANFLVAAAIFGNIEISGLSIDSKQADKNILKIFDLANVKYQIEDNKITVNKSKIVAFNFDATNCPDIIPIAIVLACFADEQSVILGANRLKHKESSRAEVMKTELEKAGISIEILNDKIHVNPAKEIKQTDFDSHNDHRIAMALSILSISINSDSIIKNKECVAKSYPNFYKDFCIFVKDIEKK